MRTQPLKSHGTEAAAKRHRRAGQLPRLVCPACCEAENYAAAFRRRTRRQLRRDQAALAAAAESAALELAGRMDRFCAALEADGLAVNRTGALSVSITIPRRKGHDTMKIRVHGNPAPKGSVQTFAIRSKTGYTGRVGLKSDNPALADWNTAVLAAALEARREAGEAPDGYTFGPGVAVVVELRFYMARPRGHYGTGRNKAELRKSAPAWPMGGRRGDDLDKLMRAVGDALQTAHVVADDKQIVGYPGVWKCYADKELPGADITITLAPDGLSLFRMVDPKPELQAAMAAAAAAAEYDATIEAGRAEAAAIADRQLVLQLGGRRPGLYVDGRHVDITSESMEIV